MNSSSSPPPRPGAGREASPPRQQQQPSTSFAAAAFQPPWALEAGRGSLSASELAVVALGRLFFFCYALLRFLLVSLNVLPGPGGKNLSASVRRLGGMPSRVDVAKEAAERVVARVLNRPLPPRPAVILCFGDSLTEGTLGADWVARLGDSLQGSSSCCPPGVVVVNAGVSGQLAAAVASRVERCVAACSGRVVGVFILCGTNDVLAACAGRANRKKNKNKRNWGGGAGVGGGGGGGGTKKTREVSFLSSVFPEAARRSLLGSSVRFIYRALNALPRAPLTRPAALAAVAAALDAAALAAPSAALAVATVPPLGGDPLSRTNAAVRDLNRGIRCVASTRPRVTLLDVHAALSAALAARREGGGSGGLSLVPAAAAATTSAERGGSFDSESEEEEEDLSLTVGPSCLVSLLLRCVFRISWDRAAQWKALPSAAAAAAKSLPETVSSSLLRVWSRRGATAGATTTKKNKTSSSSSSFSANSLLHDGVHFGEAAGACVLALTLPWARRAAREKNASSSSSALRSGNAGGTGLATALSLASSPPSPSRRRGAVVAASTSKSVAVSVPRGGDESNGRSSENSSSSSSKVKGGGGLSGALASAAIRLLASSK